MRKIDAKLDVLAADLATIKADLAQVRDGMMATSAICLRLEARKVKAKASWRSTSG